jgi:exopolyphosphatase/guanosine-5'-triphosphate,3'-diphosphate pyrophosphatase
LFGLRAEDMVLVGLVARYHRRASPKPTHYQYASLERDQRIAVAKLAAILRVADALDRSRSQRIQELQCERDDDRLIISVPHVEDLSLEQLAMKEKGTLFEEIFGVPVLLRKTGP